MAKGRSRHGRKHRGRKNGKRKKGNARPRNEPKMVSALNPIEWKSQKVPIRETKIVTLYHYDGTQLFHGRVIKRFYRS